MAILYLSNSNLPLSAMSDLHEYTLQEFANIVNGVSDETFYNSLSKKVGNVNWMRLYGLFKSDILKEITEIWNEMWEEEKMGDKINIIEKLRQDTADTSERNWRPVTGDIKHQVLHLDILLQTAIRDYFNTIADEEEAKVAKCKEDLLSEWEKLKNHQTIIADAQNRNSKLCEAIDANMDYNKEVFMQLSAAFYQ